MGWSWLWPSQHLLLSKQPSMVLYKHTSTTMSDNIEMRICSDQNVDNEDTPIETIELYVK